MRAVRDAHEQVRDGVRAAALHSAHDIAEGGLGVALAECCIAGGIGAVVSLPDGLELFGEAPGRGFVVSAASEDVLAGMTVIGRVGGDTLEIDGVLKAPVSELRELRERGLVDLA
jgi:phosphoribosylformylglycinamidine synthase